MDRFIVLLPQTPALAASQSQVPALAAAAASGSTPRKKKEMRLRKSVTTFGSDASSDVRLRREGVAAMHALLIHDPASSTTVIQRQSAANELLLNGVPVVVDSSPIGHGDTITIAGRIFRYELRQRTAVAQPTAEGEAVQPQQPVIASTTAAEEQDFVKTQPIARYEPPSPSALPPPSLPLRGRSENSRTSGEAAAMATMGETKEDDEEEEAASVDTSTSSSSPTSLGDQKQASKKDTEKESATTKTKKKKKKKEKYGKKGTARTKRGRTENDDDEYSKEEDSSPKRKTSLRSRRKQQTPTPTPVPAPTPDDVNDEGDKESQTAKPLFRGRTFILTGVRATERTLLADLIIANGGAVLNGFMSKPTNSKWEDIDELPKIAVIAGFSGNALIRTATALLALACHVPVLRSEWMYASLKAKRLQPLRTYLLDVHPSREDVDTTVTQEELRNVDFRHLLEEKQEAIQVKVEPELQDIRHLENAAQWRWILETLGAKIVDVSKQHFRALLCIPSTKEQQDEAKEKAKRRKPRKIKHKEAAPRVSIVWASDSMILCAKQNMEDYLVVDKH